MGLPPAAALPSSILTVWPIQSTRNDALTEDLTTFLVTTSGKKNSLMRDILS